MPQYYLRKRYWKKNLSNLAIMGIGMSFVTSVSFGEDAIQQGEQLFALHCVHCHDERGPGTSTLKIRLGADKALLTARRDLSKDYIGFVLRRGLNNMPWYRKTELSDIELAALAAFLTRNNVNEQDNAK